MTLTKNPLLAVLLTGALVTYDRALAEALAASDRVFAEDVSKRIAIRMQCAAAHPDPLWAVIAATGHAVETARIAMQTQTPQSRQASELAQAAARTATEAAQLALAAVAEMEELATKALAKAVLEKNEAALANAAHARASAQTAHAAFKTLAGLVAQVAIDHIDPVVGAADPWEVRTSSSAGLDKKRWN